MPETSLRDEIASHMWYHTMELAPGVVTPGWFDLRPVVDQMPWPDVVGKRCLDVGTYDGYLAFELERRGASEVIAIDIDDHSLWDWPPDVRALGPVRLAEMAGPEKGRGFRIAAAALGSKVERRPISVYDLSPDVVGRFDVVVMGSLLIHLRDPLRALEAIRSVTQESFMSSESIDLALSIMHPRRPLLRLDGSGTKIHWLVPSAAGHRRMLFASGFRIVKATRPFSIPLGAAHRQTRRDTKHPLGRRILERVVTGGTGVPHSAVLARPRI